MAYLDPNKAFEHFRDRVVEGIQTQFPVKGRLQSLHLDKVEVKDDLHPDDIRSQHQAKVRGETWAVPVFAHLSLKDNETGRVLDSRRVRIAELPKVTNRHSYIVDGKEYQVDSQWQLRPGVYTRRRQNGELESRFNVANKSAFDVLFDPASKKFTLEYHKATLPLYPLMKAMGVDDDTLEKSWGKEIFHANKTVRGSAGALERFYKSDKKVAPSSREEAEDHFRATMAGSELRPSSTSLTLGKPFSNVTGEVFKLATEKMLKVQAGHPEDDRDNLIFKDLRGEGDFAYDKIRRATATIRQKMQRKIGLPSTKDVRDIIKFDMLHRPIKQTFTDNSAARVASQINPVEMLAGAMQTTVMGPGGIQSERSITDEAKFVNPSHLGFLDPIATPEGSKTGVTLRLPLGVSKIGSEPRTPVYNLKTEKMERVSPGVFSTSTVVLPDQVRWENGKPVPVSERVKAATGDSNIRDTKFSDAHYVLRHPSQLFNLTSNLIPFLGSTSGNRASMATRHIEQAVSLVHREAPLVQVSTGVEKPGLETFEKLLGKQASHATSVGGTVTAIKPDGIHIKSDEGTHHEVQLYNYYPLNDPKGALRSFPLVKVGDKVKAGQAVADTNYSKKGTLALGTNLRAAFIPWRGLNYEDGVVISESAAKKLSSEHLNKQSLVLEDGMVFHPKNFVVANPGVFTKEQVAKVADDGVIKIGQRVRPGDPLVVAMKPYDLKDRLGIGAIRRSITGAHTDKSLRWDDDHEGEVIDVHRAGGKITVHVKTVEPMQAGDKLSGTFGNKGIVSRIFPDHEMPYTADGKHVEVLLNPSGVPGRMNPAQIYATLAGKIAEKTGKPYVIKNFEPGEDVHEKIKTDLQKNGLSDTEELFDPVTKKSLGQVLVGPKHILKLVHQVEKKLAVRSGMGLPGISSGEHYDLNLQPASGGHSGGQSIGTLGMYALLAHGARHNIREFQTWKSEGPDPQTNEAKRWPSQHEEIWRKIQMGEPLPTPKSTFAFKKFEDLLKGAGVNIEKKGHHLVLSPLTDDHILGMSAGAIPRPGDRFVSKTDRSGDPRPKPGGLFDEKLTGGHGGKKWTHIPLAEPIPNPVFELPIRHLTGLTGTEFKEIVEGEKGVTPTGQITTPDKGVTGGAGIKALLDKINVQKELEKAKKELSTAPASKVDKLLKKTKYLRALDQLGFSPSQAYILHHVPVVPPALRPVSVLPGGDLKEADLNMLYQEFGLVNDKLKDPVLMKHLPDSRKTELRKDFYDGVKALAGIGTPVKKAEHKGIIHQITGSSAKSGFFQKTLMSRRQDLSMRSTIVPEPSLSLDEVGIPRHAALDLFRPFVVRELVHVGAANNPLEAQKRLAHVVKGGDDKVVWKTLDRVMEERPVLLKRDPALHKFNVQGFKGRPVSGSAIQIHPLVTEGFTADFDGDAMSLYVPIAQEAVQEARRMFPSNNLFNEATGRVMYQPTLESALGIYKMSLVGKETTHKFSHPGEAIEAVRAGKIGLSDLVHVGGQKTTPGRVLLASALPEPMQKAVLEKHTPIDKKGLNALLTELAKKHPQDYGTSVNKLKDLGNGTSSGVVPVLHQDQIGAAALDPKNKIPLVVGAHSFSLNDFKVDKELRSKVLGEAQKKVDALQGMNLSQVEKDRRAVQHWLEAEQEMKAAHEKKLQDKPTNLFTMYKAGVKPGWDQYKQLVLAPMLLKDSADRIIPTPVTKSYSEGLDVGGYWTQMYGARRGTAMKVQEVREPGYLSKLLMNNTMHLMVNGHDCGTNKGIALDVGEKDVHDRHLAQDFRAGLLHVPAGTLLTPDVLGHIRAAKKDGQVVVRSPLKCEDEKGICQKCAGLSVDGHHHDLGTNLGVLATQAVGERAVQLSLKAFHVGGAVEQGGGAKLLNSIDRLKQLTKLPQKIPNSASLAMVSGTIKKIEHDPTGVKITIGDRVHHVGRDDAGRALHEVLPGMTPDKGFRPWSPPQVGMHVEAGEPLSDPNRTVINPHTLYQATKSIDKVQNYLASEMYNIYKDQDVRRRHIETVVKSMSNLTRVHDPGDHPELLRGEFRPTSVVKKMNSELVKAGKRPILHEPVLKGVSMMPLALQEDWMAKLQHERLKDSILDAAATVGHSLIHGTHPVPAIAFGSQFGMTSKDSKRPGLGHLADVPAHHY